MPDKKTVSTSTFRQRVEEKTRREKATELQAVSLDDARQRHEYGITLNDISKSEQAVVALRESEARLSKAQEIAHLGSWEMDISTNRLIWSDEVYRIFGLKPQEFPPTYERFLEGVHPEERATVDAAYTESLKAGKVSHEIEHRVVRKSTGEIRYVQEKCENFRDASGQIFRSVGMIQDITERKQSENRLRETKDLLSLFIKHSPIYAFIKEVTSTESRVLLASDNFQEMIGIPGSAMVGKTMEELFPVELAAKITSDDKAVVSGNKTLKLEEELNGRSYHSIKFPIIQGSKTLLAGYTIDITERKLAEEELRQAKVAAEAGNSAKSQFLANMSHEIRTPMNGVIGLIELLLGTELTREQREYAELVKLSGKNLVELISNILDLSKIEAHKIELEEINFDLRAEISAIINLFTLRAREKGLELSTRIEPDIPLLLKGDAGRLRQILINMIGNAIKFTEKGSVSLHISKEREDEEQTTLRFLVRDSGTGIAANKLEKIFEPFTQADGSTTRRYGGTGLGLTIARQLAELMGGTVGVESVVAEGTTFWFTAVLAKQAERRASPRGDSVLRNQAESLFPMLAAGHNVRILVAEDDLTNQFMTKAILEKFGYQVDVANNGDDALKLLEKNDYVLVLMDCIMPTLNGYEATAVIRNPASAVRDHAIPVIAVTANAFREDRDSCLAAGMDDYLAKPIDVTKVLAVLEKWLPFAPARETTD